MPPVLTLQENMPPAVLEKVAEVIRKGGILAIPTDSFYGLGVSVLNDTAVRRVCMIKGRPEGKPILVLIADQTQLVNLVAEVTPPAQVLMNRFWPGPLTLVMRASQDLSKALTAGAGTVGVRQPAHPALLALLHHVGPLTGTSANRSGQPPLRTVHDVQAIFNSEVDLIMDGGPTVGEKPSTVVDTLECLRIIREGALATQRIRTALAESGYVLEI